MKIVEDLIQGENAWLEWRRNKITATDAATILGMMPFGKSPLKLWQEKISGKSNFNPNEAMLRGQALEPIARDWMSTQTGYSFFPAVIESEKYPWAGASLDGLSRSKMFILEIKCPMPENFEKALKSPINEAHYAQCQHQLFVSGLQTVFYVLFDGNEGHIREIHRDEAFIKKMFHAEQEFWDCLQNLKAPPEVYGEYEVIEDPDYTDCMEKYLAAKEKISTLEVEATALKEELVDMAKDRNIVCGLGKMTKVFRKGQIDFQSIPEIKGLDLEPYRKKPIEYYLIKEI